MTRLASLSAPSKRVPGGCCFGGCVGLPDASCESATLRLPSRWMLSAPWLRGLPRSPNTPQWVGRLAATFSAVCSRISSTVRETVTYGCASWWIAGACLVTLVSWSPCGLRPVDCFRASRLPDEPAALRLPSRWFASTCVHSPPIVPNSPRLSGGLLRPASTLR
jgi:hypothetical protein